MNQQIINEPLDYAVIRINGARLTVKRTDDADPYGEDRTTYRWIIAIPKETSGFTLHSDCDLRTGVGNDPGPDEMLRTLLSFLGAAAERYRVESADEGEFLNVALFPRPVMEWAYINEDEVSMAEAEEDE